MKKILRSKRKDQGVALVTTVIVVAVLAVVAVAFMQSTTVDRLSSRSVANHYRAKLAAEAGAATAEALVADLIKRYPDSATAWQNIGSGGVAGTNNEATVLYIRAQAGTDLGARPAQFGSEVDLRAQPLVSGAVLTNIGAVSGSMTYAPSDTNMVNLNATNPARPRPFVGRRSMTNAGAPVTAARWIYLTNSSGETNARYAFWVEDESFKVNLNVITNGVRGVASLGLSPKEARLDGSWGSSSNAALRGANVGTVIAERNGLPSSSFPTALTAAIPAKLTDEEAADELKFLTSTHSAGLDVSRGGFKRFNINTVTNGDKRTALNRLIAAITNSNSVPNFGQRFYRLTADEAGISAINTVTTNHAAIYLNKIAANFLDYIDADDQPTILNNDTGFTVRSGKPEFGIEPLGGGTEGSNSVAAIGVENTPRLQEYALHGRIRELVPIGYNSSSSPPNPVANYRISIDHYFEFWNPSTRDITLTNAFLKVYDQPRYGDNITGPLASEGRPFTLPLGDITFPAGRVTVLTTAPEEEINSSLITPANKPNVISVPGPDDSHRMFTGTTRDSSSGAAFAGNGFNRYFKVSLKARSTSNTDYESAVLLANDSGILESFVGLPIVRANATAAVPSVHFVASSIEAAAVVGDTSDILSSGNKYYTVAGSLAGNSGFAAGVVASVSGDPRSINEQLGIKIYDANGSNQQTRFLSASLNNNNVPASSTVGGPNSNFVLPANWVDHSSTASGANGAPLFVRNGPMQSVGEIGHLTDPARVPGTGGALSNVVYSRGGGRTLRVGQSENPRWYNSNQTNASRTWTSWRLADVFTTTNALSIPGLINPNGVLRDGGAAWRAALNGLTYLPSPEGAPGLAGESLDDSRLNSIVTTNLARLTNVAVAGLPPNSLNPFWERGEVSELPIFNSGNMPVQMSNVFDRGREELVRRSIEMITTRGSVFSVYAVGETLQGTKITGTVRLKQTFQIEPQFATVGAFDDNFNPADAVSLAGRFAAPTNYTIRTLQTSYD